MENNERLAVVENQIKNIVSDVNELKKLANTIYGLSANMEQMLEQMKIMNGRMDKLEKEPIEELKSYKKKIVETVITTILGCVIGALIAIILK